VEDVRKLTGENRRWAVMRGCTRKQMQDALHKFAIVNVTDAADRTKLPTTNQTEGTAVTTNADVVVAPDHVTVASVFEHSLNT
jgi:hypothetical protein